MSPSEVLVGGGLGSPQARRSARRGLAGEPYVWLTGMGLAVGLFMIVSLLLVIVVNGAAVFWPKRVLEIHFKADSPLPSGPGLSLAGARVIAGEITKKGKKHIPAVSGKGERTSRKLSPVEWQLFIGNKDVCGLPFRYIDFDAIERIAYPEDIMVLERLEYGDAIGFPQEIRFRDGAKVMNGAETFERTLKGLVEEVTGRRKLIGTIEKRDIGRINQAMEGLRLKRLALERRVARGEELKPAVKGPGEIAAVDEAMARLQAEYEVLATRARDLRARQMEASLVYKLVTGDEKVIPMGQVVRYYYPNRLTFWEKLQFFVQDFWRFLADEPREANTEGGIFPAIFGTFVMTIIMSLAVTPFGVVAAIYLREYARRGAFVRMVRIAVNNLAGVPSIVFGVFGLGFFVYMFGGTIDRLFFAEALPTPTFGTGGVLWASLTLALMTVPVVIVATEESLAAVPMGVREGSLACGASKWQTIQRVVLPAAAPGIMTGFILAMARGAGEVAPLMLVGVVKLAPSLPLDLTLPFVHLERKFMHLGFHIYDLGFQSPDSEAAKPMVFATTFVLIALVIALNLAAIMIRQKLRAKYAGAVF